MEWRETSHVKLLSCPAISHPQVQLSTLGGSTYNIITHNNSLKTITPLPHRQTDRLTQLKRKRVWCDRLLLHGGRQPLIGSMGPLPFPGPPRPTLRPKYQFLFPTSTGNCNFPFKKEGRTARARSASERTCARHSLRCINITYTESYG